MRPVHSGLRRRAVTSMPSFPGIWMSMRTMSKALRFQHAEGFIPVRRRPDRTAELLQHSPGDFSVHRLSFGEQNPGRKHAASIAAFRFTGVPEPLPLSPVSSGRRRNGFTKGRPTHRTGYAACKALRRRSPGSPRLSRGNPRRRTGHPSEDPQEELRVTSPLPFSEAPRPGKRRTALPPPSNRFPRRLFRSIRAVRALGRSRATPPPGLTLQPAGGPLPATITGNPRRRWSTGRSSASRTAPSRRAAHTRKLIRLRFAGSFQRSSHGLREPPADGKAEPVPPNAGSWKDPPGKKG